MVPYGFRCKDTFRFLSVICRNSCIRKYMKEPDAVHSSGAHCTVTARKTADCPCASSSGSVNVPGSIRHRLHEPVQNTDRRVRTGSFVTAVSDTERIVTPQKDVAGKPVAYLLHGPLPSLYTQSARNAASSSRKSAGGGCRRWMARPWTGWAKPSVRACRA